ncbi:hypothetical protein [Mucilaginibacter lacusdianchii]|uniref:hypothetical protein n=1 Tax=Mucilaginibacter lacusdianchii TaxID=2684211 RepID=UPI00131D56E6|nr:hypothetical protein [Mucilaginibacter sp. JXJ CY 39]
MQKWIGLILSCCISISVAAQSRNDSLAYEMQRKKINAMLAQREAKFDQYDQSLSQRSGIFGMQTKNDIRRSNEILMDINGTDNQILKELKILLDYRAFQQQQVQTKAAEVETTNRNFMYTINQLRSQNDQLTMQLDAERKKIEKSKTNYIIVIAVLIITSILLLLTRKRRFKA